MLHTAIDAQTLINLKILVALACCLLVSPYIAKALHLPLSATEIILGSIVSAFGFLGKSDEFALLANVGFYYLMFIAGMEVNLKHLLNLQNPLLKKALLYIALMYLLTSIFVSSLGLSYIFIIIIPVMSVGLLSMLFKDFGKDCSWLKISMFVATLAEVVSIILLTITAALLNEYNSTADALKSVMYLAIFLASCLLSFKILALLFWWYPNLRLTLMPWHDKNEKDIRFCMGILILIIASMIITNLEIALGAFIAGSFIATFFNHKSDLEHKLSSFGYGFLIPIFFFYIGSTFDISMLLNTEILLNALGLIILMLGIRLACAFIFYKDIGKKFTLLFALSHSMPLTLLIATATLSYNAKIINESLYSALIVTALFEVVLATSLIKFIAKMK